MKSGKIDTVWVVRDPSEVSTLDDILFEATLESLILQVKGGLSVEERPRMYLDHRSAEADALARLAVLKGLSAIASGSAKGDVRNAARLRLVDGDGNVVFEAELDK